LRFSRRFTEEFNKRFAAKVDALVLEIHGMKVMLTPLPEKEKPAYIQELIDDAIQKGASVINAKGGSTCLIISSLRFYIQSTRRCVSIMKQFGPVVPILSFKDIQEPLNDMASQITVNK
jgi:glyceraldehyde-3-phosphate dehydrogenase (NADP+)